MNVCDNCNVKKTSVDNMGNDSFCFSCANGSLYKSCQCGNSHFIDDDNRNDFSCILKEDYSEVVTCEK